jgi:phosphatidylserine decarboxylase
LRLLRAPLFSAKDLRLRIPIHREGWPFIAAAGLLDLLFFLGAPWLGLAFLPIAVWVVAFFRDPERRVPQGANLIICPADGRLLPIIRIAPPAELGLGEGERVRLSIFMNVFNVHVNRIPCNGTVTTIAYRPGKFFNASFEKASLHNERMAATIRTEDAKDVAVVQIAGLVARRIVCNLQEGQSVCRGDRFGIIRFGSRVDVYLPDGARVLANAGASVKAGETVLADFPN